VAQVFGTARLDQLLGGDRGRWLPFCPLAVAQRERRSMRFQEFEVRVSLTSGLAPRTRRSTPDVEKALEPGESITWIEP
jgi:hypothetical protein